MGENGWLMCFWQKGDCRRVDFASWQRGNWHLSENHRHFAASVLISRVFFSFLTDYCFKLMFDL